MRDAPNDEVEAAIRPGGISKVKSRRIQEILRALPDPLDGPLLRDQAFLVSLPGVGRKTAACVRLFAYGERDVPVDTHVSRVGTRLGLFREGAPYRAKVTPPLAEGTVLLVSGRVWGADTRKPLAGAVLDVWQADAHGRYVYVSKRAEEIMGYPEAQLLGHSPTELMPPEERERLASWFCEQIRSHKPFRGFEHMVVRPDGTISQKARGASSWSRSSSSEAAVDSTRGSYVRTS